MNMEHAASVRSRHSRGEWRRLLFPRMTENASFADAYAQTITFALLLARSAGIAFEGRDLPAIGRHLGKQYALIGRALGSSRRPGRPLTACSFIGAAAAVSLGQSTGKSWRLGVPMSTGTLYETFLQEYNPELRRLEWLLLHAESVSSFDGAFY